MTPAGTNGNESSNSVATPSPSGGAADALSALSSGSQTAYIRIFWMDPANIKVNQDVTQVHWSYNGSTVSSAYANGYFNWFTFTQWSKISSSLTAAYQSGNTSILGTTTSDHKSTFCVPLPTTYTHYYYVRMWGHANGTAPWSQSSDSVDECFPFHWDKITAYGAFPGF